MTFLRTQQGFLYLAVLLDLYSRAVVSFALGPQLDRSLVLQALQRRPVAAGLVHHTDRGRGSHTPATNTIKSYKRTASEAA